MRQEANTMAAFLIAAAVIAVELAAVVAIMSPLCDRFWGPRR